MFVKYTVHSNLYGRNTFFHPTSSTGLADRFAEDLIAGELPGKKIIDIVLIDENKTEEIKRYDIVLLRSQEKKRISKRQRRGLS